jgi:hypothetical protein
MVSTSQEEVRPRSLRKISKEIAEVRMEEKNPGGAS